MNWNHFKKTLIFGALVYPACIILWFYHFGEAHYPIFLMTGYALLVFLSLIINLFQSKEIITRILGYVLSSLWIYCMIIFINHTLYTFLNIELLKILTN